MHRDVRAGFRVHRYCERYQYPRFRGVMLIRLRAHVLMTQEEENAHIQPTVLVIL